MCCKGASASPPRAGRREFGPGMPCLIPAGFKGLFEVLEPVRKIYVMIERLRREALIEGAMHVKAR